MNKIQVTAQQRANALEALNVFWPTIKPEQVFDRLLRWRSDEGPEGEGCDGVDAEFDRPPVCGTVACFGGWLEWYAPFRAQLGLAPDKGEVDIDTLHSLFGTTYSRDSDKLNIFAVLNDGFAADIGFEGTDHELVSHRLRWLIENSEVVA